MIELTKNWITEKRKGREWQDKSDEKRDTG